jgi:hypothetical protein
METIAVQDETGPAGPGGITQEQVETLWELLGVLRQKVDGMEEGVARLEAKLGVAHGPAA